MVHLMQDMLFGDLFIVVGMFDNMYLDAFEQDNVGK